ncbi:MAG: hypothetical protein IKS64_03885, partial [Muribaculaceae bacterium]|nr:hypothetical protein [Muribaculaceae bacterium]
MTKALKAIRLALFARRNGVVADALRAAGDPHELIMGCPLSDIIAVARERVPSAELAEALWADTKHRECRLLAPMLYPIETCDETTALRWCHEVQTEEEADVLCHRLLRHLDCAIAVMETLLKDSNPMLRYTAFRLMLNLQLLGRLEIDGNLQQLITNELSHSRSLT